MRWFTRHPDDRELNRFADGELGERELARVSDHLARCPRCRGEVALVRRMGDSARGLPGPLATEEVLRRALARRAAGDRVLLPNSDAGAARRRPITRFAPAAIAAMLTLMVASLVVSVRVLEADRPALRLYPERPAAGEALRVEYHGGSLFADQTHLKLRARFRTADDRHWQLLAGILVRDDDGTYRTEVQLPDSVVYAAFAVEDLHGERLDSNNRELWDVMVHRDGQPTLDAMMARTWDLERRDWGEAYQQTLRMTDAYPDEPQSWAARFSFETDLFDRDSVEARHREEFERLERNLLDGRQRSADGMAWLGLYALARGDKGSGAIWIDESLGTDPHFHAALEGQIVLWAEEAITQPSEVLAKLDSLWSVSGSKLKSVPNLGWQVASEVKDAEAAQMWLERYLEIAPREVLAMAPRAYRITGGADAMGDWIERQVANLDTKEGLRPLQVAARDHQRIEAAQLQRFLATVATEAWQAGDAGRAIRLAETALDLAWESSALLDLSELLIANGRVRSGVDALARATADPATAAHAKARAAALSSSDTEEWKGRASGYETAIHDYVMAGSIIRYVDPDLTLRRDRETYKLSDLQERRPVVLAFMSRLCAPALDEMPRVADLGAQLSAAGVMLIVIDVDNTNTLAPYARLSGLPMDIYVDRDGLARAEMHSSATPDFFVLDGAGRVRFEHSRIDEILRQVQAIQSSGDFAVTE